MEDRNRRLMQTYAQYLWYSKGASTSTPAISPDLKNMADWTSCALIGSSGSLIGAHLWKMCPGRRDRERRREAPITAGERGGTSRTMDREGVQQGGHVHQDTQSRGGGGGDVQCVSHLGTLPGRTGTWEGPGSRKGVGDINDLLTVWLLTSRPTPRAHH